MSNLKTMNIMNAFQIAQSRKRKSISESILENKGKTCNSTITDQFTECKVISSEQCLNNNEKIISNVLNEVLIKVADDIDKQLINDSLGQDSSENQDSHNSTLDKSINLTDNDENNSTELNSSLLNSSAKSSDFGSSVAGPSSSNLVPNRRKQKRMTPAEAKQRTLMKEKLREEKRLAKEAEKLKKENERNLAKLQKQQKKEEEEKEKEKLRREKKEHEDKEKQQKQLEKEERLKLKHKIQEAKAEEKKIKEQLKTKILEDKLKAIEEKKKLDEEKLKMELEKEKQKAKTKQAFEKFFLKSSTSSSPSSQVSAKENFFLPFQVSEDMVLAPVIPIAAKKRFDKEQLDEHLKNQDCCTLYLGILKSDEYECVSQKKAKSCDKNNSTDVVILDAEPPKSHLKGKLFQFDENIRPPYWGTWRKKSKIIRPRRPFAQDEIFDYEVDSEEEWDEGGPGESLTGTEDEESEDDYEVDNEFFVPHGYLSAEEEGEDETPVDPEIQKARLKMKEKEFLSARSKKTTELKPIILGCYFQVEAENGDLILEKTLHEFTAEILTTKEIFTAFTIANKVNPSEQIAASPKENKTPSNMKRSVPEEAYPYLIRLLHGNTNGRHVVIKEFQNFWLLHCEKLESAMEIDVKETSPSQDVAAPNTSASPKVKQESKISKRQLFQCITAIATWCKPPHPTFKKFCWWVKEEVIQKYELTNLPIPNEWTYTSTKDSEDVLMEQSPKSSKITSSQ